MFISMEQFAHKIGHMASDLERSVDVDLVNDIEDLLMREVTALTPEDTGQMKRSWKRVPWKKPGRGGILNDADPDSLYPQIVNKGRRRSKSTRRMLGSKKAKRGVAKPIVNAIKKDMRKYIKKHVDPVFR